MREPHEVSDARAPDDRPHEVPEAAGEAAGHGGPPFPVPPVPAQLRPNSAATRVCEIVYAHHAATGDGMTTVEINAEYRRRHDATWDERYGRAAVGTLSREHGFLVAVGGRPPHTRYGCPELPPPAGSPDPRGDLLVATVRAMEAETGTAPSTEDVGRRLRAEGHPVTSSARLGAELRIMTRRARRGQGAWMTEPRLERVDDVTITGHRAAHWRVLGSASLPTTAVRSEFDATRHLVVRAETALGRPVPRHEVAWWMDRYAGDDDASVRALVAGVPRERLHYNLELVAKRPAPSAGRAAGRGEVRRVERLGSANFGPSHIRYAWGDGDGASSPAALAIMDVELAAETYAVAAERAGIAALGARVARLGARAGGLSREVHAARAAALRQAVDEALPRDAHARDAALAAALRATDVLATWADVAPGKDDVPAERNYAVRRALVRARRRDLEAMRALIAAPEPDAPERAAAPLRVVGDAGMVTHDGARMLVELLAVPMNDAIPLERLTFIQATRRLRLRPGAVAPVGPTRIGQPAAGLDRVDALSLVARAADVPRLHGLLDAAVALLGHVVRDADWLADLLARHPGADPADRRAAVVARGVLGAFTEPTLAAPDPGDPLDARAYVLACALADQAEASRLVRAADRRATTDSARQVTGPALRHVTAGRFLALIG